MKHAPGTLLLLALVCAAQPVLAMNKGTTDLGLSYMSGGIDAEEIDTINGMKNQYSLSILTAAKGSGAYLANVRIRITDGHSVQVLDAVMDGPWMLVNLPAGHYRIEATLDDVVRRASVTLAEATHRQEVIYFDTHDKVEATAP